MKAIICAGTVINRSNTAVEFSSVLHHDHDEKCDIHIMAGHATPERMTNKEWVNEQMADPVIGEVCKHLIDKTLHQRRSKRGDSDALKKLLKHQNQLILRNNLVYHKIKTTKTGNPTIQFVLPLKFRERALEAYHDEIGHLGFERSIDLLRDRFLLDIYECADMEKKIKNCDRCLCFKATPQKASLCLLEVTHPLELIHMDYLKIESNQSDKDVHILIVTDHFT